MPFGAYRYYDVRDAETCHAEWIRSALAKGHRVDLITIQFREIPVERLHGLSFERQRLKEMYAQTQRLFSSALMRYVRNPRDPDHVAAKAPQFIIFPDYPVGKRSKCDGPPVDVHVNGGGLHLHIICIQPALSRKGQTIEGVIGSLDWILKSGMTNIHFEQVTETPGKMSRYMLKGIKRDHFDIDDVLVLPRAVSELGPRKERIFAAAVDDPPDPDPTGSVR